MAEATKPQSVADSQAANDSRLAWWKSPVVLRWAAVVVVGSIVFQGALFVLLRKTTSARSTAPTEYTVGTFSFTADSGADAPAAAGKFDLHIRFIEDLDGPAHQRLAAHQFRVRESVENLLRKSHGLELNDTAVARLKHELQERIDDALDLRAVAEVIITDLSVDQPHAVPAPELSKTHPPHQTCPLQPHQRPPRKRPSSQIRRPVFPNPASRQQTLRRSRSVIDACMLIF